MFRLARDGVVIMPECEVSVTDQVLLDYWAGDLPPAEADRLEEHLFACRDCSGRLEELASIGAGLASLVRQGRISGAVSRALVNRMQRAGVRIRQYSLSPGETVPCAVFPGDDLVMAALHADFTGVESVTLSISSPARNGVFDELSVSRPEGRVLWVLPSTTVRGFPSMRLELTLTASGPDRVVLGRYVLDHEAAEPEDR